VIEANLDTRGQSPARHPNSWRASAKQRRRSEERPRSRAITPEALFAAGDRFNEILDAVAGAIEADERIKTVLESPRVSKAAKGQILERALKGEAPREFVRFLQAVVRRGVKVYCPR